MDLLNPNEKIITHLIKLQKTGQFPKLISDLKGLKEEYPKSFILWNIYAMASSGVGNILEAENGFRKAQKLNPEHPDAYNNLAVILQNQGKFEEAIQCYKKAIKIRPDSFQIQNNLGIVLQLIGNYSDSICHLKLAVKINPNYATAYLNLGTAYYKRGDLAEALVAYKQALKSDTKNHKLHNNIGLTFLGMENYDQALLFFKKALSLKGDYAEASNNIGHILNIQEEYSEAEFYLRKAISIKPNDPIAHNNLGKTLMNLYRFDHSINSFEQAIKINPNYAQAYNNLGNLMRETRHFLKASEFVDKALKIKPDFPEAYNNKGIVLKSMAKYKEALKCYQKALKLKPNFAEVYNNLGNLYVDLGKFKEGENSYKRALKLKPEFAEAYHNLGNLTEYTPNNPSIGKMLKIFRNDKTRNNDLYHICFALSKAYEDIGKIKKSYDFLTEANSVRKKLLNYDISSDRFLFSKIKETANAIETIKKDSPYFKSEKDITRPIFIIGMPRSGTTLVEQILSRHSDIWDGGELEFANNYGFPIINGNVKIEKKIIETFRNSYLEQINFLSNSRVYITDKMPQNFIYLGLIINSLPEAKIVHVTRNPMAVCWSNYKLNFTHRGLCYAYDLSDVVEYYNLYSDLMEFWKKKYEDHIYHVDYEKLTTEPEHEIRKIVDFIGLKWENACLTPQDSKRFVQTISNRQIRKAIYKGSSKKWEKYEPFLAGAFDSLKEFSS